MSTRLHGTLNRLITPALLLLASLSACDPVVQPPGPIASFTFSQLVPSEPIGFQLAESQEPVLLVRVEGTEAAFESSLLDANGKTISTARLPYLRVGPVFHIIEHQQHATPLTVNVRPTLLTRNSLINVQVFALPSSTRKDITRIDAYKNYSRAIQLTDDESAELWSVRIKQLRAAVVGFERANEIEAALWTSYLDAYFSYFPVGDYKSAHGQALIVQQQAQQSGFPELELMAMQLQGQILIERDKNDSPEQAKGKQVQAQEILRSAADLASHLGMMFERAWAINSRGIGYYYQGLYAVAEQHYQEAIQIALDIEDDQLQKLAGGNLALVRERQGDLDGALEILLVLNRQLQASDSRSELAHNWSELSRLYQRLFLFPQSVKAQGMALEIWRTLDSAEGIGRSLSSLAHDYHSMGNAEMALAIMLEAIEYMETANFGWGLREGFRLTANIYRADRQFDLMSDARGREANYLTSVSHRSRFQYELGLDVIAQNPGEPAKADEAFAMAGRLGLEAGNRGMQILSRLQRCANSIGANDELCTGQTFQRSLEEWLASAPPSRKLQAQYLWARILANLGHQDDSLEVLDQLIAEVQLYRTTLPGVLGAWYWESRSQIFKMYMDLNLDRSQDKQQAEQSLLALNRLLDAKLNARQSLPTQAQAEEATNNRIRVLLARLETADTHVSSQARQAIDRELLSLSAGQQLHGPLMDPPQLEKLLKGMPPDSALLAYYFSEDAAWAWLADSKEVRLIRLSDSFRAVNALSQARKGMRVLGNMGRDEELRLAGEVLLGPLKSPLPGTIYLLSVGELAGFPFEAVRHNGRYFGQDHDVINLLSLNGLQQPVQVREGEERWNRIVLAGDPQGEGVKLPRAAQELNSIARQFEGREITLLTGADLGADILLNPRYAEADLFHFASHGQINFKYPELSRLILSGENSSERGAYLTPLQIGQVPIGAGLVVLSACETTGVNTFSFERNLGYVSQFLHAGANAVVASLWPVSDDFAQEFMQTFYALLIEGKDAPRALAIAKRRLIARGETAATVEWASFQIYLR